MRTIAFYLLFLAGLPLYAEGPPLSVAELVDIALSQNPETRQAWWSVRHAADHVGAEESAYYPWVEFGAVLSTGRTYKFVNGPDVPYTVIGADLSLSYLLMDFGERRYNVEAAKAALIEAEWQSNWTMQKVMFRVISSAQDVLKEELALQAQEQSLKEFKQSLDAVEQLAEAGLRSVTDVYTSKVAFNDLQIAIIRKRAALDIARGALAMNMGLDIEEAPAVAPLPDPGEVPSQGIGELVETARQKRSDLIAQRAEIARRESRYISRWASTRPKLRFSLDGGSNHYVHDGDTGLQYQAKLSYDVPLFTGFEETYRRHSAYADVQIAKEDFVQIQLEIALEVLTYAKEFEAAKEILKLTQEHLENSVKSYEGTFEKYRAGEGDIFDLTAAQRHLVLARLASSNAKIDWYRALAHLAYATGTLTGKGGDS